MSKKKIKGAINFINLANYVSPQIEMVKSKHWVTFGDNNNYFQFLLDRYNGSPTNSAVINAISLMTYGKGLAATDSNKKPDEYARAVTLFHKEAVRKLVYDLKLFGQCAIQVIYSKDRKTIAQIEHLPVQTLAIEKVDEEDQEIKAFYYFPEWEKIKPSDTPQRIAAFGTSKDNIELLYVKPYVAGYYYFSPVDYQGGLQYCELEEEIANYHLNNILNGLAPSMMINFNNGVPNEEERELLERKIRDKYSGSSNAGRFILSFNDSKDSESTIEAVQLSDAHEQYKFLSDESMRKILVSHRVVSPMLIGIKDQTGLGNNADEIKTASTLMDNTVIRPFQELLLDAFDKILSYNNISLNLYFITLQPLEFTEIDKSLINEETQEEETGVKMSSDMTDCQSQDILGSLYASATKITNNDWELVDELDEDAEYSTEDWANYLVEENKNSLQKLQDYVTSKNKGSAWSSLDSKNGIYKIRYKYQVGSQKAMKGKNQSRNFCRDMMNLSNAGFVWRIEDIELASWGKNPVNAEFRHRPSMKYNIFKFKGGVYCRHKWVRVLYRLKSRSKISNNLKDYKKTLNIPKSYLKSPRGTSDSKKAPVNMPNKGHYPGVK
tara:strand:- start:318 stop:2141 length:1824 start_codon:yes stop_codon:yes gene_type:complete